MVPAEPLQQSPGRIAFAGVESKVKNSAGMEAESAFFIGQLVAGQTEVQQDGINAGNIQLLENLGDMRKIGLGQADWQILARLGKVAGLDWEYGHPLEIAMEVGRASTATVVLAGRDSEKYSA